MELTWDKPVIVFYKERADEPERKAFLVVKARRLVIFEDEEGEGYRGRINDFFPLMGDIDYLSSNEGTSDHYVLCWFEDKEEDLGNAWRRLTGVTFRDGLSFDINMMKKKTYNANFRAQAGKLK